MTISVARFRKAYPEFKGTPAVLVQQKLDMAELMTSRANFEDLADTAVMLRAADLLAGSPSGEKSRLQKNNQRTIYAETLSRMSTAAMLGSGRLC